MAKSVGLFEGQIAQMELMLTEKKTNKEIRQYFQENYKIDLPAWSLSYHKKKLGLVLGKKAVGKVRKNRKLEEVPSIEGTDLSEAIKRVEEEIKSFCTCIRKLARKEIIKYVATLRKTRINMGDEISETEAKSLENECKRLGIDMGEIEDVDISK